MPTIPEVSALVRRAQEKDGSSGSAEHTWNERVHFPLLELAVETSIHKKLLVVDTV
jgi:hypothetical protein